MSVVPTRRGLVWTIAGLAGAVVALWTWGGLAPMDWIRYVGFEATFALVPGWALVWWSSVDLRDPLGRFTLAWATGTVMTVGATALSAALGHPGLVWAYPPAALATIGLLQRFRPRVAPSRHETRAGTTVRGDRWWRVTFLVAGGAAALVAFDLFLVTPPVTPARSVSYAPDLVYHAGLISEVSLRWPPQVPQLAGEPLHYHWFVHAYMGAAATVTGLDPWVILTRLAPITLTVLAALQISATTTRLTLREMSGPVAGALLFLAGEIDPSPAIEYVANGTLRTHLWSSPTFTLGLVLAVPLLDRLRGPWRGRQGSTTVLLLIGAAGAKATILPVLLGGLVLYATWRVVRKVFVPRWVPIAAALTAVVLSASLVTLYGGGSGSLVFDPLASLRRSNLRPLLVDEITGAGRPLIVALAALLSVALLLAPISGVLALRRWPLAATAPTAWLVAVGVAGVGAYYTFDHLGGSQVFFLHYGYVALIMLSAAGFVGAWGTQRRRRIGLAASISVALVAIVAGLAFVSTDWRPRDGLAGHLWVAAALIIAVAVLRSLLRHHEAALLLLLPGLVAIDAPLDAAPTVAALASATPVYNEAQPDRQRGLDAELLGGLEWVASNTEATDVIAVNNHRTELQGRARYFYYSAFTRRRVFLEAWDFTDEYVELRAATGRARVQPFPVRAALNSAAFEGHRESIRRLASAGVTLLVADLRHAAPPHALRELAEPRFTNGSLEVFAVSDLLGSR
ncbi:MAG: hypothetical protein KY469_02595 [Actinobacteria bacterium]|nr:hypothetical protein [Actinomycetota bacterium]